MKPAAHAIQARRNHSIMQAVLAAPSGAGLMAACKRARGAHHHGSSGMTQKQRLTPVTRELADATTNLRQFVPRPRAAPEVKEIASRNPVAPATRRPDDDDPGPAAA